MKTVNDLKQLTIFGKTPSYITKDISAMDDNK